MGFLSSLFGYKDKPALDATTQSAVIPEEMKPYVRQVLADTQGLYEQRMDAGYEPYTGQTIAPLTAEEVASQEGLKSLIGTQAPFQQEALTGIRGGAQAFTPEAAQQYMSPYMRAVIDSQKEQAQRQYERTEVPKFEADAVRAGGMSGLGTRAGVEAAERADLQNRLLADIEAKGQQEAYKDALNIFEDQKRRERLQATDLGTAGQNIFASGVAEQGLLQDIGETKRDLAQSTLDEAYLKYLEERQFPEQQLARYQTSIYGNPLMKQPSFTGTSTKTPAQVSMGKNLLGLGLGAMKTFAPAIGGPMGKMFGSFLAGGGQVSSGLSSIPQAQQYMAGGGRIVPPVVYRKTSSLLPNKQRQDALGKIYGSLGAPGEKYNLEKYKQRIAKEQAVREAGLQRLMDRDRPKTLGNMLSHMVGTPFAGPGQALKTETERQREANTGLRKIRDTTGAASVEEEVLAEKYANNPQELERARMLKNLEIQKMAQKIRGDKAQAMKAEQEAQQIQWERTFGRIPTKITKFEDITYPVVATVKDHVQDLNAPLYKALTNLGAAGAGWKTIIFNAYTLQARGGAYRLRPMASLMHAALDWIRKKKPDHPLVKPKKPTK